MGIFDIMRQFIRMVSAQVKESDTLLRRAGVLPAEAYIDENFRNYGQAFNVTTVQEYTALAHKLYNDAKSQSGTNPNYSVMEAGYGRLAIDYNGEMRGIYTIEGRPLAFFRPNYQQLGYSSKKEELEAFRRGVTFRGWRANS